MALYKWIGKKNVTIEVEPPKRDRDTKQVVKEAVMIRFRPREDTSIDGRRVRFDKSSGYFETDDPKVKKFIERTAYYKSGAIIKVTFKREAVFVEKEEKEEPEEPKPFTTAKKSQKPKKVVHTVDDV